MAIYEGPFASGMRGKLGNVVGAKTVGGRTAMRAYKEHIKNPNTQRQQVSRAKMKKASGLAAIFANAIGIGYAKAVQGAKMYARNMFVSDLIPNGNGYMSYVDGAVQMNNLNLPLSRACGITVLPSITATAPAAGGVTVSVANPADVVLKEGESLGAIVTVYDSEMSRAVTKMVALTAGSTTTVTFAAAEVEGLVDPMVAAFIKVIPAAVNGIATETIPWKYPSATSGCAFAVVA